MEWVLLSLVIIASAFGATGGVVYYYHRFYDRFVQQRLLQEKQLEIYEDIVCLMSNVKATLDYTSGDETLRQWKAALMEPIREILRKSYQWSVFLPEGVTDLTSEYASKIARSLARLDNVTTDNMQVAAEIIAEVEQVEEKAAKALLQKIREAVGVTN